MIKMVGKDLFGCMRDGGEGGYQIGQARPSMTSHGKKDASSEQIGTADEGQTRRQNASEWQGRGWSLVVEAEHAGPENIIHQGYDHTAESGLRLIVVGHQDRDVEVCSFGNMIC
jgi:hypothetical protein